MRQIDVVYVNGVRDWFDTQQLIEGVLHVPAHESMPRRHFQAYLLARFKQEPFELMVQGNGIFDSIAVLQFLVETEFEVGRPGDVLDEDADLHLASNNLRRFWLVLNNVHVYVVLASDGLKDGGDGLLTLLDILRERWRWPSDLLKQMV